MKKDRYTFKHITFELYVERYTIYFQIFKQDKKFLAVGGKPGLWYTAASGNLKISSSSHPDFSFENRETVLFLRGTDKSKNKRLVKHSCGSYAKALEIKENILSALELWDEDWRKWKLTGKQKAADAAIQNQIRLDHLTFELYVQGSTLHFKIIAQDKNFLATKSGVLYEHDVPDMPFTVSSVLHPEIAREDENTRVYLRGSCKDSDSEVVKHECESHLLAVSLKTMILIALESWDKGWRGWKKKEAGKPKAIIKWPDSEVKETYRDHGLISLTSLEEGMLKIIKELYVDACAKLKQERDLNPTTSAAKIMLPFSMEKFSMSFLKAMNKSGFTMATADKNFYIAYKSYKEEK